MSVLTKVDFQEFGLPMRATNPTFLVCSQIFMDMGLLAAAVQKDDLKAELLTQMLRDRCRSEGLRLIVPPEKDALSDILGFHHLIMSRFSRDEEIIGTLLGSRNVMPRSTARHAQARDGVFLPVIPQIIADSDCPAEIKDFIDGNRLLESLSIPDHEPRIISERLDHRISDPEVPIESL